VRDPVVRGVLLEAIERDEELGSALARRDELAASERDAARERHRLALEAIGGLRTTFEDGLRARDVADRDHRDALAAEIKAMRTTLDVLARGRAADRVSFDDRLADVRRDVTTSGLWVASQLAGKPAPWWAVWRSAPSLVAAVIAATVGFIAIVGAPLPKGWNGLIVALVTLAAGELARRRNRRTTRHLVRAVQEKEIHRG
jgi:hypothetical protein